MHMAIAILRTAKGLDYSDVLATGVTKSEKVEMKSRDKQSDGSADEEVELGENMLRSNEPLGQHGSQCNKTFYRVQNTIHFHPSL